MRSALLLVSTLAAPMLLSLPAHAARKIAVFPLSTASTHEQRAVDALGNKLLSQLEGGAQGISVMSGAKLARALGAKPAKALTGCGGGTRCAADLGRRAGAAEVLLISVSVTPSVAQFFMVAINVASAEVARTVVSAQPSIRSAKTSELLAALKQALGSSTGASAADGGSPDDMLSLPTSLDAPAPPAEQPPVAAAAVSPLPAPAAAPMTPLKDAQPPAQPSTRPRPWLIAGLVSFGAAAITAGVGTYFGIQYATAPRTAPSGMSQIAYAEQVARANTAAQVANVTLITAGAFAGLGVTAMIIDALRPRAQTHTEVRVGVAPSPNGVNVALSGRF